MIKLHGISADPQVRGGQEVTLEAGWQIDDQTPKFEKVVLVVPRQPGRYFWRMYPTDIDGRVLMEAEPARWIIKVTNTIGESVPERGETRERTA